MSSSDVFAGRRGRVALGLLVAEFTAATQSLVVTTVMPKIAADLHGFALYGLAYAVLFGGALVAMVFAGPAADRYGIWRVLVVSYVLALVGLFGSMLAPTMPLFVSARALEGLGGGLDYVVSVAAIAKLFPEEMRPRMFAWVSAMWVVPGLVGPALGALIAATLGWRYVFALFVPLILLSAMLVLPSLRAISVEPQERARFQGVRVNVAMAAFAALQAAFFGADAYVSLLLTAVRGLSLGAAGACITVAVIGWTIGSSLQPRLVASIGTRALVSIGALLGACALVSMFAVVHGAPLALAYIGWALGGTGIGLSYATLTLAALSGWPEGSEGTASSATLVAGSLGSTAGVFLCGLPITVAHNASAPLTLALSWTFGIALAFAVVLFGLASQIKERVV